MKDRINNRRRRRLASLLAFVLLVGYLMPTALMQTGRQTNPPPVRSPVRPSTGGQRDSSQNRRQQVVKLDPSVVRAVARTPIPFKPLEMVDPRTGKAVTPDTMLKLDNGRQITAAKYYEQMNKLEAGLNKMGYSFRDQQKEVVTNEVVIDKAKTLAQIRNMRFTTPDPKTAARLDAMAKAHREYIRMVNPNFGRLASERSAASPRFTMKIPPGLYQKKVGALMSEPITILKPSSPIKYTVLERPDFVPGDSEAIDVGKETESLPGISSDPGWAAGGKKASAIQINASWTSIAFYVNYLNAPTAVLAPKYVWQVAKAGPGMDNFGAFGKAWSTQFDDQEMQNWKNPPGLIASGDVNFYFGGALGAGEQKRHLFQIDFGKFAGNPPDDQPVNYLVRVIPVNANGSIAGYPSRPVLVSYGKHLDLYKPPKIVIHPNPAKIPINNLSQQAPASFGNPKVMSIAFNTWAQSNGSLGHESASIGFDAGCSVYGHHVDLVKLSANGELSPIKYDEESEKVTYLGESNANVSIVLGGVDICGLSPDTCKKSGPGGLHYDFDKSQPIDESFTLDFPIGPIDVSATIGISGEVGVGGYISLSPTDGGSPFSVSAGPHLSVSAFLETGVGIGLDGFDVVEVKVKGNVNLISAGFVVQLEINNSNNNVGGYYAGRVSDFQVLNGTFDGYAKAGICPFCKKWTHTLYSWDGYDMLATDPKRATLFEGSL